MFNFGLLEIVPTCGCVYLDPTPFGYPPTVRLRCTSACPPHDRELDRLVDAGHLTPTRLAPFSPRWAFARDGSAAHPRPHRTRRPPRALRPAIVWRRR